MVRLEIFLSPKLKDRVAQFAKVSPHIRRAICFGEVQPARVQYGNTTRPAAKPSKQRVLLMAILVLMASLAWAAYMVSQGIIANASTFDEPLSTGKCETKAPAPKPNGL